MPPPPRALAGPWTERAPSQLLRTPAPLCQRRLPPQVTAQEPRASPGVRPVRAKPSMSHVPCVLSPLGLPDDPQPAVLCCPCPGGSSRARWGLRGEASARTRLGAGLCCAHVVRPISASCLAGLSVRQLWRQARGGGVTGLSPIAAVYVHPVCVVLAWGGLRPRVCTQPPSGPPGCMGRVCASC